MTSNGRAPNGRKYEYLAGGEGLPGVWVALGGWQFCEQKVLGNLCDKRVAQKFVTSFMNITKNIPFDKSENMEMFLLPL